MTTTRAGVTAAVCTAALLLSGCTALRTPGRAENHITADFRDTAGIFDGNPVTVLGLRIGTVDKIIPHGEYNEVHMSIDASVQIPEHVVAALVSPSIVTNRHIELTPRYTGGPALPADAHLTVQQTRTPIELDTMIKTIDQFAAALEPEPGADTGPLSGELLYSMVNGQGQKIHDTLAALSGALKVGVGNGDAITGIISKLNELTTMLADNDHSVREFSDKMTQLSKLLAEQAPGLQATLDQLNGMLANTSGTLSQYQDQLAGTLSNLTSVTAQLRANAAGVTETADLAPLLLQNLDRSMDRSQGSMRGHVVLGTALTGEVVSLFCDRIQMRSDGCRTGRLEDFGPDLGLTSALLGLTR
ncbi:MCE family protein [Nocardia mikamii]|uniref:MCE family protein n=1 Tax=Nocardia mikamii TaxID=508464 RepID=UPI0007A51CB0|nr:MCE family protein [Nocardia mikamii]